MLAVRQGCVRGHNYIMAKFSTIIIPLSLYEKVKSPIEGRSAAFPSRFKFCNNELQLGLAFQVLT